MSAPDKAKTTTADATTPPLRTAAVQLPLWLEPRKPAAKHSPGEKERAGEP